MAEPPELGGGRVGGAAPGGSGNFPSAGDSTDFLQDASMAAELTDYADARAAERDVFAIIDPVDAQTVPERVKKKLGLGFWIAAGWMILIIVLAALAPFLPVKDPEETFRYDDGKTARLVSPFTDPEFPLGTDGLGRDLLARTVWGARVSLTVGVFSVFFGLVIGGFIGLIAGFFRGKLEAVMMAAMDVILAFPALLLALAIVTFSDKRTTSIVVLAIGIVAIPPLARLIRANTLVFAQREFVLASRTLGAKNSRIIIREILPNVSYPAFSFAIIGIAVAIVAEGGLAFLGLSLPPPTATWGTMINEGRQFVTTGQAFVSLVPATAMLFTILALNFAGDRLREYFDVKEGGL